MKPATQPVSPRKGEATPLESSTVIEGIPPRPYSLGEFRWDLISCCYEAWLYFIKPLPKRSEHPLGFVAIYEYHRNVKQGDYLKCRFCGGESPGHVVHRKDVKHCDGCKLAAAIALADKAER